MGKEAACSILQCAVPLAYCAAKEQVARRRVNGADTSAPHRYKWSMPQRLPLLIAQLQIWDMAVHARVLHVHVCLCVCVCTCACVDAQASKSIRKSAASWLTSLARRCMYSKTRSADLSDGGAPRSCFTTVSIGGRCGSRSAVQLSSPPMARTSARGKTSGQGDDSVKHARGAA